MSCATGYQHTITISGDNVAYSFGCNWSRNFLGGQLGLGHDTKTNFVPSIIPNLPKIQMVSCGHSFTVCIDHEGFVWSFGYNVDGQLGTGSTKNYNTPQKIENIPPVKLFLVDHIIH